jgi:DNA-binding NarL/FixJ family response regulator
MSTKKRVLIVDDHPLFREGLKGLINRSTGYEVAGEAVSGQEAIALAGELQPDLVTMDITMGDLSGIDATREICRKLPQSLVLIVSMHANFEYVAEAFRAGARGYVVKDATGGKLIEAFDALLRGECYLDGQVSPQVVTKLLAAMGQDNSNQDERYGLLSPREQQVMRMVAEGHSTRDIAERLALSTKTVDNHRTNLMRKLDVHSRLELVRYAVRLGLIDVEQWKE